MDIISLCKHYYLQFDNEIIEIQLFFLILFRRVSIVVIIFACYGIENIVNIPIATRIIAITEILSIICSSGDLIKS